MASKEAMISIQIHLITKEKTIPINFIITLFQEAPASIQNNLTIKKIVCSVAPILKGVSFVRPGTEKSTELS